MSSRRQFELFPCLPHEMQMEILEKLEFEEWLDISVTSKQLYEMCNVKSVFKSVVMNSANKNIEFPSEYGSFERSLSENSINNYWLYPDDTQYLVIGSAYNPLSEKIPTLDRWSNWYDDIYHSSTKSEKEVISDLTLHHFMFCANITKDRRGGFFEGFTISSEKGDLDVTIDPRVADIHNKPSLTYHRQNGWVLWDFQSIDTGDMFIPCRMWVMPLFSNHHCDLDVSIDTIQFFETLSDVMNVKTIEDLTSLYNKL